VTQEKSETQSSNGDADMSEIPAPDAQKSSDSTVTQTLTFHLTPDQEITTRSQEIVFNFFTKPQEEADSDELVFDLTKDNG